MSRGITETDVCKACDALLLEGARPTIERVRQKIGRGSPNTVSPHLDTWFKNLGGRIRDPAAFSAPPDVPDPVVQAARHLWQVAAAETRLDFDQRLTAGLADATAAVQSANERAGASEEQARETALANDRLRAELVARTAQVEQERQQRAADQVRLEESQRRVEELQAALQFARQELDELRTSTQREITLANERVDAVHRRAATEIDAERTARTTAEKRLDTATQRLVSAQEAITAAQATRLELNSRIVQLQADVTRLSDEKELATASRGEALSQLDEARQRLAQALQRADLATGQFEAAQRFMDRLKVVPMKSRGQAETRQKR